MNAQEERIQLEELFQDCSSLILAEKDAQAVSKLQIGLEQSLKSLGAKDTTTAKFYEKLGVVHYNLYAPEEAILNYKKSLAIKSENFNPEHVSISDLHYKMALCYFEIGSDSILHHLNESIRIQQNTPSPVLAKSYMLLAEYYLDNNDTYNALKYFQSALTLEEDIKSKAVLNERIAGSYSDLNEPDSIIYYLTKARKQYESIDLSTYYKNKQADCYFSLGNYYLDIEDFRKARQYFNKALVIYEKESSLASDVAGSYINLGIVDKRENNIEAANRSLQSALSIYEAEYPNVKYVDKGLIYHNLGDNFALLGSIQEAMVHYQKASENFLENYIAKDKYSVPSLEGEIFLADKNNLLINFQQLVSVFQLEKTEQAQNSILETYKAMDFVIDNMRQDQQNEDSKLFWREKTKPLYEQMLKFAFTIDDPKFAYHAFEKSKSVILLDELKDELAMKIANIPSDLLEKIQQIELEISDLEININAYEDRNEVVAAIHILNTEKQNIIKELEEDYPSYYNYKYDNKIVSIEALRKTLVDADTGILEFFLGQDMIYRIYITQEDIQLDEIPIPENFNGRLTNVVKLLSDKNNLEFKREHETYKTLKTFLYNTLLGKLENLKQTLIVIPDGIINYIPFEVLGASEEEQLIDKHTISYAYSCNVLSQNNFSRTKKQSNVAFFAPMQFRTSELTTLSGGNDEAELLEKKMHLSKFMGTEANLANFTKSVSKFNILHLSTHASANDSLESNTWIAFSDSLLYLDQIYSLPIQAELIVLSACQTSLGNLATGEGVMSLARAFTYAGASSSLTSLWEVNEKASQEIIQYFYDEIISGNKRSDALRNAKLKYQELHPESSAHYWSGFILFGDSSPLQISQGSNTKKLIPIGISIFAALFLAYFLLFRKSN